MLYYRFPLRCGECICAPIYCNKNNRNFNATKRKRIEYIPQTRIRQKVAELIEISARDIEMIDLLWNNLKNCIQRQERMKVKRKNKEKKVIIKLYFFNEMPVERKCSN